jgi:hypothetical protein
MTARKPRAASCSECRCTLRVMGSPPAGQQSNVLLIVGIILGLLLPIGGLIIAVILFATGRAQQGLYVALATLVGVLIGLALYL